jgi:hypothetical protein
MAADKRERGGIASSRNSGMPNQTLQQTGHANDVPSWRHASSRVSRLLSLVFGGLSSGSRSLASAFLRTFLLDNRLPSQG